MKNNINTESNYIWTELKVEFDRANKRYRVTPLNGVYPITLEDTNGDIKDYFENDLVKGPDRFLIAVYEVGLDYYKFEFIMNTNNPSEIFKYIDALSRVVVKQNLTEPTVMTLR